MGLRRTPSPPAIFGSIFTFPLTHTSIGVVTLTSLGKKTPTSIHRSRSSGCCCPRLVGFGSEVTENGSTDQLRLKIEDVVVGCVGGEEPLCRGSRLELLLLSLQSPNRQMRVFSPVVFAHAAKLMAPQQAQHSRCTPL